MMQVDSEVFKGGVWDAPEKPPYVHCVSSAAEATRIVAALQRLAAADIEAAGVCESFGRQYWQRRIFACDTEVRLRFACKLSCMRLCLWVPVLAASHLCMRY